MKELQQLDKVEHHSTSEKLVKILQEKTQNTNPNFFRIMVGYYLGKVASMMRCKIATHDRGTIPVNVYAINLAVSGSGKGHSMNILEDSVIDQFRERFLEDTLPEIAEIQLAKESNKRALRKNTDPDEELERVNKEYEGLGPLVFSFDSGTVPAVKQMRHKLLMSDAGSMNLEIDEIGNNLLSNVEVLTTFLELYDVGKIKQKLTKNTNESTRNEEIHGKTPTNLLLFGTPAKLLNGGKIEEEFYSMLETGYARRCFFGYSKGDSKQHELTPEQVYDLLTNKSSDSFIKSISNDIAKLADPIHFNKKLSMTKEVSLISIAYKLQCEKHAATLGEHDEIRKAEVSHRYFKALKLAGTYAFVDGSNELTKGHMLSAIKLTEESGKDFQNILNRERNYVKLAKYISHVDHEITHADLVEQLPFYRGTASQKQELMNLAIAYGYKNNIIIRKSYNDGIEFLQGESLDTTDLSEVIVSYSDQVASGYRNEVVPFDKLHKLTQQPEMHWVNHHLEDGYRNDDHCIPGANLLVLDIDDGETTVAMAQKLLEDYTHHIHTTKQHTESEHRFRIVIPMSHTIKMDGSEYKEFMQNIFEWLPFKVDSQTGQRSRKWRTHDGEYFYNEGEVLDVLPFIPRTSKNEERKKRVMDMQSLSNLERWFVNHTGQGNRSNQLVKYALLLVDSGMNLDSVRNNVLALNNKLQDKLDESEILSTIMVSATKHYQKTQS